MGSSASGCSPTSTRACGRLARLSIVTCSGRRAWWARCSISKPKPPARAAQWPAPPITLTVAAGHPLDIRLDQRVTITRVGQPVTGVVVQPVYAYDRVVVPAGTKTTGHVAALDGPSKVRRVRALLSGD